MQSLFGTEVQNFEFACRQSFKASMVALWNPVLHKSLNLPWSNVFSCILSKQDFSLPAEAALQQLDSRIEKSNEHKGEDDDDLADFQPVCL